MPILTMIMSLFALVSSLILIGIIELDVHQSNIMTYLFILSMFIFFVRDKAVNKFGVGSMSIYYLFLVSFGFPIVYLINPERADLEILRPRYLNALYYDEYIALSILAFSCIIIGINLKFNKREVFYSKKIIKTNNYYFQIGIILISAYALYLAMSWMLNLIPLEYLQFKEWAANQAHNYLQMGFWFGVIFCISTANRKQLITTILIALIPTFILTITGNRNDFLYPLLIGIGIYVHRVGKIPKKILILVGIMVFVVSPIISSTRAQGITLELDNSVIDLFTNSLLEIGAQLNSVSQMFYWLSTGEMHAFGMTYLYATLALFIGIISPTFRNLYFASRFSIESRLPMLAFTMPAELFFNFNFIGVFITYIFIGRYIRNQDTLTLTEDELVKYGFWSLMLLHWVRNQFYFSATYIFIFFGIFLFEKYLLRPLLNERSGIYGRKIR